MNAENPRPKEILSPRHLLIEQPTLAKAFEYGIAGIPVAHKIEIINNKGKSVTKTYVEFHDTKIDQLLNNSDLPLKKPLMVTEEDIHAVRTWLTRYKTAYPYIYDEVYVRGKNKNGINVLPDYESMHARCSEVEGLFGIESPSE